MSDRPRHDRVQRRRLRLGALLFHLRYYMQASDDIAAGIYRLDATTYVQVAGEVVQLVDTRGVETLDLEAAIARCKEALGGSPLHRHSL